MRPLSSVSESVGHEAGVGQEQVASPHRRLTWVHQISRHAATMPEQAAIRHEGGTVTWAQLHDRSLRLAAWLRDAGVAAGDRVLVLMENGPDFAVALLAVQHLRAVAVPINFRLAAEEVTFLATDADVAAVVVDERLLPLLREVKGGLPRVVAGATQPLPHPLAVGLDEAVASVPGPLAPGGPLSMHEPAAILYTSGTTGRPKGAMLSYEGLVASSLVSVQMNQLLGPDEIRTITTPQFHVAGLLVTLTSLLLGHTTVIVPSGSFDAETFLDLAETERATNIFLVPSQWELVCRSPSLADRDLAVRTIAWGAAPASPELLRKMAACFPHARIVSTLGQTETSGVTTWISGEEWLQRPGSVGRAAPVVSIRVVDADMNDCAPGQVGEIVYQGPTVMMGYWDRPEATADAFRGGWFHSGDLVRADEDGYIYVVDRIKDMIISGGENIYPAELEHVLAEHPKIREVAVIGRPDPRWGETPVAVVVPEDPDDPPTHEEVVACVVERLASYKKPSETLVVDTLARNASGKVLKPALREAMESPLTVTKDRSDARGNTMAR
jgi:fatty-acyl-CoA synthase